MCNSSGVRQAGIFHHLTSVAKMHVLCLMVGAAELPGCSSSVRGRSPPVLPLVLVPAGPTAASVLGTRHVAQDLLPLQTLPGPGPGGVSQPPETPPTQLCHRRAGATAEGLPCPGIAFPRFSVAAGLGVPYAVVRSGALGEGPRAGLRPQPCTCPPPCAVVGAVAAACPGHRSTRPAPEAVSPPGTPRAIQSVCLNADGPGGCSGSRASGPPCRLSTSRPFN